MKLITLVAVVSAGLSCAVVAQTERDLDSHEHGLALLNIAVDSENLFIELDSPWNNLVGFEHEPSNDEQQTLVDNALAQLNDANSLFGFEGAECTVVDTLVENSASDDDHNEAHGHDEHDDEKDHDDDAHHDEHDDEKDHDDDAHHDEHDDEKDHDDDAHHDDDDHDDKSHADHDESEHEERHSAVRVAYSFECNNINKLEAIDVKFFALWSGFEELNVQMIGPSGQAATNLTPNANSLDITQVQ